MHLGLSKQGGDILYTISHIIEDINRGCAIHNMVEDSFLYRVVYYVNEKDTGRKHCIDTTYGNLRKSLESIIRENLSLQNTVVIAQTTIRKDGQCICLQSRSYRFCMEEYFRHLTGKSKKGSITYGRYAANV